MGFAACRTIAAMVCLSLVNVPAGTDAPKPRVMVMTDIGGDPDDVQSMVRFLVYACDFQVEGLLTGLGHGHSKTTRPELIRKCVEAYGKVLPRLREHRKDYPAAADLLHLIKRGHDTAPHEVGKGKDTEASDWIIKVLDRPDPRPVWFTIWGGPRELAQALWKLQTTRTPEQVAALKKKIRVHSIADQDRTAGWVKTHHPDVFWIYSRCFRGFWWGYEADVVSPAWLEEHVRTAHGPLGPEYPAKAAGKTGVKEGDTPSFLYVLPNGLSDPERPEWGNWGGRFRRSGRGMEYVDAADDWGGRRDPRSTIARWRRAYQNAFQARMDWCVKPYAEANHEPVAVCNDDRTRNVLTLAVEPGTTVSLNAKGSSDPDGHAIGYRWWVYREAGSFWGDAPITGAETPEAAITVPADASGRTVHVILEVTDRGDPALTAYRRVLLQVGGEPKDRNEAVTSLEGPPEKTGPWDFFRATNLGGKPLTIDGHKWEGDGAPNVECRDRQVNSPGVRLRPPTDAARAAMIHAFRWNREARIALTAVPAGTYAVYAYVWEDNNPETFGIWLNGRQVVRDYYSGVGGDWRRLGPWTVEVQDGSIQIRSRGGAANFSGIEVWRRR